MSVIPFYGDPTDPVVRAKYGFLESAIGLIGNSSLFVSKLVLGLLISSIALFGDSLNHLTDIGISLVIFFGFRLARKEADMEHPYGHSRAEQILSIAVASLVIAMGAAILMSSAQNLMGPTVNSRPIISLFILGFAGVKELMARFAFRIGERIESRALIVDGWNHRFDAILSVILAAGIYLTTLGEGLRIIDPLLGIVVALVIVYTGIKLVKESGDELLGKSPSPEVVEKVVEVAKTIEGVRDAHEIRVHDYGTKKVMSLHIAVEESITVKDAHLIATEVEDTIRQTLGMEPTVHVEPLETVRERESLERMVAETIQRHGDIFSSHKIEARSLPKGGEVNMHIIVDGSMSVVKVHELVHDLTRDIKSKLEGFEVHIHVEPCIEECDICEEICSRRLH